MTDDDTGHPCPICADEFEERVRLRARADYLWWLAGTVDPANDWDSCRDPLANYLPDGTDGPDSHEVFDALHAVREAALCLYHDPSPGGDLPIVSPGLPDDRLGFLRSERKWAYKLGMLALVVRVERVGLADHLPAAHLDALEAAAVVFRRAADHLMPPGAARAGHTTEELTAAGLMPPGAARGGRATEEPGCPR